MTLEMKANLRELPSHGLNQLRTSGMLPAEVYGHGQPNLHVLIEARAFEKIYKSAGESSLIDLNIEGQKPLKVLIREVQRHPVTDRLIHIDFQQIRMDEMLETSVPLVFIGESKAVKELGGTLVQSLEEIKISCLPGDLIPQLEVSIESLNDFGDIIRIKDLNLSEKIKVLNDPEDAVATIATIQKEEAVVAAPEATPEPEVIGKEKKEGEEGTEADQAGKKEPAKKESEKPAKGGSASGGKEKK